MSLETFPSPPRLVRQNAANYNNNSFSPLDLNLYGDLESKEQYDGCGDFTASPYFFDPDPLELLPDNSVFMPDSPVYPSLEEVSSPENAEKTAEPAENPLVQTNQICAPPFLEIVKDSLSTEKLMKAFEALHQELQSCEKGCCRAYHTILNEWLCARLSRVAAAQMMVRYFAYGCQVCYIFKEVTDKSLIRRYCRSCLRAYARKQ